MFWHLLKGVFYLGKKSFITISLLITLVIAMVTAPVSSAQSTWNNSGTNGTATWMWNTNEIVTMPDSVLSFAQNNGAKTIYLQVNYSIPNEKYKTFISKATSLGINVEALEGAPSWALDSGASYRSNFIAWVSQYQASCASSERFSGIHLDIEPYLNLLWSNKLSSAVYQYQKAISFFKQEASILGIEFTADIPFWFDTINYKNKNGKGQLYKWVIDNTDSIAIMSYRDLALGDNGIFALVKNELDYAQLNGKSVMIGIETENTSEGDFLTFYGQTISEMDAQLDLVYQLANEYSSFGGFSIHHIDSWMKMK